ncbi:hypothetical protein H6G51_01745 [Limnothrix sp. FACHB-708]|uniref:hypothetical protein n=1 Tax=unclassified Limnothrix TaxID=2632864 RepID=UPI001684DCCF|nr:MULTISPECIES: hypothetical protein [unclassified Limnothrix]MBD2551992.1 hypothetical protein [Limnothrix sp. FACHB-708]MBD2589672.1 hypothetical protein [Limnothrix sp. FACHB-406]
MKFWRDPLARLDRIDQPNRIDRPNQLNRPVNRRSRLTRRAIAHQPVAMDDLRPQLGSRSKIFRP